MRNLGVMTCVVGVFAFLAVGCSQPAPAPAPAPRMPPGPGKNSPNTKNLSAVQYYVLVGDTATTCKIDDPDPNPDPDNPADKNEWKHLHTGSGKAVMFIIENQCKSAQTVRFEFSSLGHPFTTGALSGTLLSASGASIAFGSSMMFPAKIRQDANKNPRYAFKVYYNKSLELTDPDIIIEF